MQSPNTGQFCAVVLAFTLAAGGCGGTSSELRYAPVPGQQIPLQQVLLFKDRATFDEVMALIKVESTEVREKGAGRGTCCPTAARST